MASDDLTAPLGWGKRGLTRLPFGLIGIGIISIVFITMLIWVIVVDDPYGGEPVASLPYVEAVEGVVSRDIEVVEIRPSLNDELGPNLRNGDQDGQLGPRYELQNDASGKPPTAGQLVNPDSRVSERTDYGFLPRISSEGVRPLDVYARPFASDYASVPKIAVIIKGLGLSETGTQNALEALPPEMTLAFGPYGVGLDRWMQQARSKGHELLLQVPLEPFDYPDDDPGPHTLLVNMRQAETKDRLAWILTRMTNYVGVLAEMGARYTSEPNSLEFLFGLLKGRGLMFVDNGTSSRSVSPEIATKSQLPFSGADVVLDTVPRDEEINAQLLQLEGIARSRGMAVAVGSALPVTVRQLEAWAQNLEERGLQLVPVSATIDRPSK